MPHSDEWQAVFYTRVRAVLHAAREEKVETLVLGAFGCGAFGNPPDGVAPLFAKALASDEFRGAFATVVFAILEFQQSDSGNIASFVRACGDAPGGLCAPPPSQPPPVVPPVPEGGGSSAGLSAEDPMDMT